MKRVSPPKYLDLELTNACPAACPMCPRDKLPQIGLMSETTFNNILLALQKNIDIQIVGFCGIGEPLLHPRVFDYIRAIKELPLAPRVALVSAGEKLTPFVFEKLKEIGLDRLELSIQAIEPDLYAKLMPGLKLGKVMENIEYIASHKSLTMVFSLSITVHQFNEKHVPAMLAFAKSRQLAVELRKLHSRAGNLTNSELLRPASLQAAPATCKIFELINFISWEGDIQICCQDVGREYIIGNINKDSFAEIRRKKAIVLQGENLPYAICRACDDEFRYILN